MADYYYAELLFDPDEIPLEDVVVRTVGALMSAGCEFSEVTVPTQRFNREIKWGEFKTVGLDGLRPMCEAAIKEGLADGRNIISFPQGWGRVMFEYKFEFEDHLNSEIWDEEEETNALSTDLGVAFTYSPSEKISRYILMRISFWEDFVLNHGSLEVHIANMRRAIGFFNAICSDISPYFGAMNKELHISPDRSLDNLKAGKLPEGNEYVFVGKRYTPMLDLAALAASGHRSATLCDGSIIIEFTDRWTPGSALG